MGKWSALVVLSLAQFLMVLDQAVMNVSITQLVEDFDTNVTTIQGVITFYSLTMATLMITGGKVGDILGRRRAFTIGHVIYGAGSLLTAVSWSVGSLLVGWSILEGVGAALVLPALVALVASNYHGRDRVAAFGVIGGVSGAGIAVGPIVGGFFTTELSWRWVFVGEVIVATIIVVLARKIADAPLEGRKPHLDYVGAILTALGLGMIVIAALQSSSWGWVKPKDSPIEPFGFSLTPFLVGAGFVVLWIFTWWQDRRVAAGKDPLVKMELFKVAPLRSGLASFLSQNLVLLGVFFTLPLFLQIVLGYDALETGIRMLPISIAMFLTSTAGPALAQRFAPRRIVQAGFVVITISAFMLVDQVDVELESVGFSISLAVLGIGMGLIASQLGNVIQSSVGPEDRGEAGGLQYTAQQLGSSLGTALIGAVVISALVGAFVSNIRADERVSGDVTDAIEISVSSDASFVSANAVESSLAEAGVEEATSDAVVTNYEDAQLQALKVGFLLAAFIALGALLVTRNLPGERFDEQSGDRTVEPAEPDQA